MSTLFAQLFPLLLLATPGVPLQDARLELPDGPAAKAWAAVGPDTMPAELSPELRALAQEATTPEAWEAWARSLERARPGAVPAAPEARAALVLFARAQGRARDAWRHLAALGAHPEWVAALTVRLLPGIPHDARVGPGGMPLALPSDVRLDPLVPPTSGDLLPGQIEWRSATLRGLAVGAGRVDVTVTVESTGVQIDLAHAGGGDTAIAAVLPVPEGFDVEAEYLDWDRLEAPVGGAIRATVTAADEEPRAVYGRTFERRVELPTGPVARLPRQLLEGGLRLEIPADDPDGPRIARIAAVVAELLDAPVAVVATGEDGSWTGTRVPLGVGDAREARLAYLASRIEELLLDTPEEPPPAATDAGDEGAVFPAEDGARFVFLGDSITHEGHGIAALYAFLVATRPQTRLRLENAGVSGDTVTEALERLDAEVVARDPAGVVVQLGMNDAGYGPHDPARLARYETGLARLLERIAGETSARIVVAGPTLYDPEDAKRAGLEPVADYDATLAHYRDAARTLSERFGAHYVDLAAGMRVARERLRATDPDAGLTVDGVHPNLGGALAIAAELAPLFGEVPTLRLALTPPAVEGGTLEASEAPTRLPVPFQEEAAPVARALELNRRWNEFELEAVGLEAGRWTLEFERRALVRFEVDAEGRIAAREDLALETSPWHALALEIRARIERLRGEEVGFVRNQIADLRLIEDEDVRREKRARMRETLRFTWIKLDSWDDSLRLAVSDLRMPIRLFRE